MLRPRHILSWPWPNGSSDRKRKHEQHLLKPPPPPHGSFPDRTTRKGYGFPGSLRAFGWMRPRRSLNPRRGPRPTQAKSSERATVATLARASACEFWDFPSPQGYETVSVSLAWASLRSADLQTAVSSICNRHRAEGSNVPPFPTRRRMQLR